MNFTLLYDFLNYENFQFFSGPRPQDNSTKGFYNFQFMSVHFWDENPNGKWTLEVKSTEAHVTGTMTSQR